ncbi:MAG: 16S rRNA (adenine(1518)-N(6)/adenine(1519)-N(6))-dimethyltransferase RsmA [Candidatus Izemoplasmatales bacterium]
MKFCMDNSHNQTAKNIVDDDFFIKKKFSQNFLLDENIINKIIKSANIDETSYVIEIGPGLGALTKHLVKRAKKLLVYEVDKDLIPILNDFFKGEDSIKIINEDFLKIRIDEDIKKYLDGSDKVIVISNLPYHITTPIIMKILEESENISSMTMMMQLEVARRLTSKPNTKDYNALSIIIQDQTEAEFLFKVPKTVFKPKPKVDSAVIKLTKKPNDDKANKLEFYKFLHQAFAQRRKTLVNNLADAYPNITKDTFKEILHKNLISDTIRGEALSLEEFKKIYNDFLKERKK